MSYTFARTCTKKYASVHFQGKHNVVGVYDKGRLIGKRCVSCGSVAVEVPK